MASSTGEEVLNLMLIGKTGEGKSATGNTILGHRMFAESSDTTSETKDVVSKFSRFDNFLVKVVDCPGIMDTEKDSGQDKTAAALNMATALGMCDGGVDAFILVIKRERFTEEKRKSLDALKKIFGDRYMNNLIVVVTFGDMFKEDMEYEGSGDINFKDWCSLQKGAFKKLFDDFSHRFLLINNRENDPQINKKQRREIIELADSIRKQNLRYTSKSFEEAKATRDGLIIQENLQMLNESLQMKVGLLAADLLKLQKAPSEKERKSIIWSLEDLKNEITEKDKGTGLLNHLMAKVEQMKSALSDVDKYHSLAKEMENIREEKSIWSRYKLVAAGLLLASGITTIASVVTLRVGAALVGAVSTGTGAFATVLCDHKEQILSTSEKLTEAEKNALDGKVTLALEDIKK